MVESPEKATVARESMDQVEMSEGMLRMKSSVPLFSGVVTEAWPNGQTTRVEKPKADQYILVKL